MLAFQCYITRLIDTCFQKVHLYILSAVHLKDDAKDLINIYSRTYVSIKSCASKSYATKM